jgi:uncharacterized protein involved in exopolysaccharide biosynthesis|tara:strand:- start:700 stop:2034 length:1335 start_codon:yes stop_codon:yes gene_type:complete
MNDVSSIFFAIYSRRLMVMLVLLGSIGAGVFYSLKTPSEYLSVAKVLIPATSPTVSLKTEGGNIPNGPIVPDQNEDLRVGILGIIRSGAVHDRVAKALPGIDAKTIRKNVIGDIGSDSFLHVLAYAKTQAEAAMLANAFSDAFQDEMQAMLEASPRRTLESFIAREPIAWEQFSDYTAELVRYLEVANFTDVEVEVVNMLSQRQAVQQQIEALELQHSSNLAQRPVYEQLVENRPEFVVTGQSLSENSVYKSSLERSNELATELALKKLELKDKHPEIVRLTNDLLMVQERMSQQAQMTHASSTMSQDPQALSFMQKIVEIDIAEASYDSQKTIFEQTASKLDSALQSVPEYRADVSRINAQIAQARNHAEDISARRAELEFHLTHGLRFTMSNEYTKALPEKALPLPTPVGIMIFSTLAGLIVGILAAVVSELVKQMRLRSPY